MSTKASASNKKTAASSSASSSAASASAASATSASSKSRKKTVELVTTADNAVGMISSSKKKSSKLIVREITENEQKQPITNIIMHLKCSLKDLDEYNTEFNKIVKDPLQYNPEVPPELMAYNKPIMEGVLGNVEDQPVADHLAYGLLYPLDPTSASTASAASSASGTVVGPVVGSAAIAASHALTQKEESCLNAKMKELKIHFYLNDMDPQKKSACLWCAHPYDNKPFFLPKHESKEQYTVYGNFCSPECAAAYLFKERIDDSIKFERYHLLNKMYYSNENENIRPAPNPHYLLDHYLGNLTIQEYRQLLKTKHPSWIVIEKPMSRVLPELHTENDSGNGGDTYKIKRQSEQSGKGI